MNLDYVDIFYHHRPDPDTPIEETVGALEQILRSGKALYVGISNYRADQAEAAIKALGKLGGHMLIHQPSYSMFNRWIEQPVEGTGNLKDVLRRGGRGLHRVCAAAERTADRSVHKWHTRGFARRARPALPETQRDNRR